MAITAEALVERQSGIRGRVLVFDGGLRSADRLAYLAHKRGEWSLPKSYLTSRRRAEAVRGFDGRLVIDRADLEILGERVISWRYMPESERHVLEVHTYIQGIHPELGTPHFEGWTPLETIVSRAVYVEYSEKDKTPEIEVIDRLPKQEEEVFGYSNSTGRKLDIPTNRYFALPPLGERFPGKN